MNFSLFSYSSSSFGMYSNNFGLNISSMGILRIFNEIHRKNIYCVLKCVPDSSGTGRSNNQLTTCCTVAHLQECYSFIQSYFGFHSLMCFYFLKQFLNESAQHTVYKNSRYQKPNHKINVYLLPNIFVFPNISLTS
jgi:hypothetical protein